MVWLLGLIAGFLAVMLLISIIVMIKDLIPTPPRHHLPHNMKRKTLTIQPNTT